MPRLLCRAGKNQKKIITFWFLTTHKSNPDHHTETTRNRPTHQPRGVDPRDWVGLSENMSDGSEYVLTFPWKCHILLFKTVVGYLRRFHIIKNERLVSKMEDKTNFSRRLKQFYGLSWLILTRTHILRQIFVTASANRALRHQTQRHTYTHSRGIASLFPAKFQSRWRHVFVALRCGLRTVSGRDDWKPRKKVGWLDFNDTFITDRPYRAIKSIKFCCRCLSLIGS